jgi:alkylresorcinol/alkylpyrone synthase
VSRAPRLVALATAVPPHVLRQADARTFAEHLFAGALGADGRLMQVFEHAQIDKRHMCMPLEWFGKDRTFAEKNALYVEHAVLLAGEATRKALARARLEPADIDHVLFVSSTGLATPSVDALLANQLGFRSDVRRTPVWGLGCAGGAAGLSRARDFARAEPSARVLLIALELCSLTFQYHDHSKRNLVAASLFGDGAAAALVVGAEVEEGGDPARRPLGLIASQSTLWKDTEDVMGWTVDGAGLHVVFSRDIPTIVREQVRPSLIAFLTRCGLALSEVPHLVAHPGGVKVLNAYAEALERPATAFRHARDVLRDYGNMSSPSCLFVLERFLDSAEIQAGDPAVLAALGPGFSAEYVLLRGEPS